MHSRINVIIKFIPQSCACTALQTIVPVPRSLQTTFTVRAGDTAILPCPVPPGALLESYSVTWSKDDITVMFSDPRFDLNKAYSLVIHSVNLNDSSFNYRCVLCVTNPNTGTRREVRMYPDRDIPLTLHVIGMHIHVCSRPRGMHISSQIKATKEGVTSVLSKTKYWVIA